MSDYDFLNAYIKGLSNALLTPQFYDQVLALEGPEPLVDSLLASSYGPALRLTMTDGTSTAHIEAGLRRSLFTATSRILMMISPGPRRLIKIPLRRWDIVNILTLLRGKVAGHSPQRIAEGFFPAGELDEPKLISLAAQPTAIAVADTLCLWDFPFAFPLRKLLAKQSGPEVLKGIEGSLSDNYFSWALGELAGESEDVLLIRGQIQYQIDLVNVVAALRYIRQRDDDACTVPVPLAEGRLHHNVIKKLQQSTDLDVALEMLAGTYFAPAIERGILAFGEHRRLGIMERFLECVVLAKGCLLFRANPLGVGVAAGFIWRIYNEFLNLRIILRGKTYGRPAGTIREELLIV
jgi:V/A-type H+/Na+-transporting ATPase subunit C